MTDIAPLPWHRSAWASACAQVSAGRFPHALLLAGPEGIGKQRFAAALARLLLCHSPQSDRACGQCAACDLLAADTHGDLHWLRPPEGKRTIVIDQLRSLGAFLQQTPGYGERKVVVLEPAEAMNRNAANALLKSLEEPSGNTCLILVSHRPLQLPATIRSRCQRLRLPEPTLEQGLAMLQAQLEEPDTAAQWLALAGGYPMRALRWQSLGEVVAPLLAWRADLEKGTDDARLNGIDAEQMLEQLQASLHAKLRAMAPAQLRSDSGRAMLQLVEEAAQLRRAVAGGSNPNLELLAETLRLKLFPLLGPTPAGDKLGKR